MPRFHSIHRPAFLLGAFVVLLAQLGAAGTGLPDPSDPAAVRRGGQLARTYCVTCHLFPEPQALDRATWHDQVLPRMKYRLGFSSPDLEQSANIRLLREQRRIPDKPVISETQWLDLAAYYLATAPEQSLPQEAPPPIAVGIPGFEVVVPEVRVPRPSVTSVRVLPDGGALVADNERQAVVVVGRDGRFAGVVPVGNAVASLRHFPGGILTGGLGSFLPADDLRGAVFWLTNSAGWQRGPDLIADLPRTADANAADLNGDGRLDYVVSVFGNNVGRLSWWEARPDGGLTEHELFGLPGTLRTEIADFNGDGHPDIAALVAQETEALFLFLGNGRGGFERTTVFQRPPYWGHSHFETADFNGDGRPDFLVTNGDNGEFTSPSKRYHGIRIHLSQPEGGWKEASFFPMYGAYRAVARDVDLDGDLDIAAIAFFPDYQRSPRGSFVFLQNDGTGRFQASTFAESATGRWLALDGGDFDGDGAVDFLLGSYIKGPTPVPAFLMEAWEEAQRPLILLRNVRPRPSAPSGSAVGAPR
ncbi:MAG: VCBS repeat-containing protein [Verrucomicrobiae bacterium]|nr:VCBS repeat-containing protein [Verrucomicrobiae bacterium]